MQVLTKIFLFPAYLILNRRGLKIDFENWSLISYFNPDKFWFALSLWILTGSIFILLYRIIFEIH